MIFFVRIFRVLLLYARDTKREICKWEGLEINSEGILTKYEMSFGWMSKSFDFNFLLQTWILKLVTKQGYLYYWDVQTFHPCRCVTQCWLQDGCQAVRWIQIQPFVVVWGLIGQVWTSKYFIQEGSVAWYSRYFLIMIFLIRKLL